MIGAKNRYEACDLLNLGIENIYRELLDTSLSLGKEVQSKMDFRKCTSYTQVYNFIKSDEDILRRLAKEPQ